jgi:hypothetical protein
MGHFRSGADGEGRAASPWMLRLAAGSNLPGADQLPGLPLARMHPELFFFGTLRGGIGFSKSTMPVLSASDRKR